MKQSLLARSLTATAALALSTLAIAPAAHAAPVSPGGSGQHAATATVTAGSPGSRHLESLTSGEHLLITPYQEQRTSWWCGPTAVAMALGVLGVTGVSQESLAAEMGTSPQSGTGVDGAVGALRNHSGAPYEAVYLPEGSGSQALWNSIVQDIDGGFPVVTAIGAPPHTYPYYDNPTMIHHFFVVDGYDTDYNTVHISDPANFNGVHDYWITMTDLAYLVGDHYYFW